MDKQHQTSAKGHLRVLHLISGLSARFGGPAKVLDLCKELSRQGLRVSLYTNDLDRPGTFLPWRINRAANHRSEADPASDGLEVRSFPTQWPSRFGYSPQLARRVSQRISEYDLVHIHGLYLHPGFVGSRHARRNGIPYIIEPHGSLAPVIRRYHRYRKWIYEAAIERNNLRYAAALHFASSTEMRQAQDAGIRSRGLVLPLGVNLEEFDHLPARGSFKSHYRELQNKRLVVFFGRLTRKKGLDLLADAFSMIASRVPDAHLVIAGPDDEGYGQKISRKLRKLGLSNRVTMTGLLVGESRLALFADADVWVLPSYDENFGIAAVEAMACRLPIVLSENVHISRQAADANAALVVSCQPTQLAAAVESLLSNSDLCSSLGASAFDLARRQFTWTSAVTRIIDAYQDICKTSQSTHVRSMVASETGGSFQ